MLTWQTFTLNGIYGDSTPAKPSPLENISREKQICEVHVRSWVILDSTFFIYS